MKWRLIADVVVDLVAKSTSASTKITNITILENAIRIESLCHKRLRTSLVYSHASTHTHTSMHTHVDSYLYSREIERNKTKKKKKKVNTTHSHTNMCARLIDYVQRAKGATHSLVLIARSLTRSLTYCHICTALPLACGLFT